LGAGGQGKSTDGKLADVDGRRVKISKQLTTNIKTTNNNDNSRFFPIFLRHGVYFLFYVIDFLWPRRRRLFVSPAPSTSTQSFILRRLLHHLLHLSEEDVCLLLIHHSASVGP
jgi:hypothetical protein